MVVSESLLFPGLGSAVDELAVAVFEMIDPPPAVTFATIVTVTDAPGPRFPGTLAVTVPLVPTAGPLHEPRLELQETNVVPVGSGSFMTMLTAVPGPLLVTVIV